MEAGEGIEPPTSAYETDKIPFLYPAANGGGDRDRTCDIQLAKLALSQLSYTPQIYQPTVTNRCIKALFMDEPTCLLTDRECFNTLSFFYPHKDNPSDSPTVCTYL